MTLRKNAARLILVAGLIVTYCILALNDRQGDQAMASSLLIFAAASVAFTLGLALTFVSRSIGLLLEWIGVLGYVLATMVLCQRY